MHVVKHLVDQDSYEMEISVAGYHEQKVLLQQNNVDGTSDTIIIEDDLLDEVIVTLQVIRAAQDRGISLHDKQLFIITEGVDKGSIGFKENHGRFNTLYSPINHKFVLDSRNTVEWGKFTSPKAFITT